jgi:hypothetical protein
MIELLRVERILYNLALIFISNLYNLRRGYEMHRNRRCLNITDTITYYVINIYFIELIFYYKNTSVFLLFFFFVF